MRPSPRRALHHVGDRAREGARAGEGLGTEGVAARDAVLHLQDLAVHGVRADDGAAGGRAGALDVGFGRIVVSEKEAPIILVSLVSSD